MSTIISAYIRQQDEIDNDGQEDDFKPVEIEFEEDSLIDLFVAMNMMQDTRKKIEGVKGNSLKEGDPSWVVPTEAEDFYLIAPYLETRSTANEILNAIARTENRQQALDMLCDLINERFFIKIQ